MRPEMEREYKPPQENTEKRTYHRHPFVAEAEVTELRTGARIAAQTTELSPSGCYLGAADPFAEGAKVRVRLTKDGHAFETSAIVLRVHAEFGMGVAFDELNPAQQAILDRWLDEIPG
ncbi:MAG TPA: PilZ domain-containing protein [Candidatus Acidoferrales bacterium]|nr:PilZ domain-containing protein [Candidatus Acidoferrales bacterium]